MMTFPFFSILVPVYNVAPYLRECLDSVLGQSYPNFELLLVDDGSTDDSGSICDEYAAKDARIRVFHKPNGGQMAARCLAIANANGEYYVFLDSDDTLVPNALATLRSAVETSGADCVIYGIQWHAPDGGSYPVSAPAEFCGRLLTDKRMVLNLLLNDESYNSLCRKCTRAACFDGRDYSPWFSIQRGEDRLQSMEILENAERFYFLHEALYLYRLNENSITHSVGRSVIRPSFRVEEYVDASLRRLGVFMDEDYDRLRNHELLVLVIAIKRICRAGPDRAQIVRSLGTILAEPFYRDYLSVGFRCVPPAPGVKTPPLLRRCLDALVIRLLDRRRFGALIFLVTRLYRAR